MRQVGAADQAAVVDFTLGLCRTSRYTRAEANPRHVREVLAGLLVNPAAGLFVAEANGAIVGLIGLVLYAHLISGVCGAAEIVWYVHPDFRSGVGRDLLRTAEHWAAAHGAQWVQMMAPDERFAAVYARHGYRPVERVYERSLTCLS